MRRLFRAVCISFCAVALLTVSLITPAMARYSNTAFTVTPYGQSGTVLAGQTLSAETEVYDFGVYTPDMDTSDFTHTVRLVDDTPISGMLRFAWDEDTQARGDITADIDGAYYTEVYPGEQHTDYIVSVDNGILEIPFQLTFTSPEEERLAKLEVSWYPDGADEATLFARYWVAVLGDSAEGTLPTFVEGESTFITRHVLQVTVTTPGEYLGVLLTPGDGVFAAGTRYCNAVCTEGAVLLRDSALFVPRTDDTARMYVDATAHLVENNPISLRVGVSDTLCSDLTCTPSDTAELTVSLSDSAGVLTVDHPLTVTLTTPTALYDDDWSQEGHAPSDLKWRIFRRVGNALEPVTVGEQLTVDINQNDDGGTLTVSIPDDTQPAGTYVLLITQTYFEHPVMETPIWFFIDYR